MPEKENRGGSRKGSGRKPIKAETLEMVSVYIDRAHRRYAERIGSGNLSAGVRILLDAGINHIISIMPEKS